MLSPSPQNEAEGERPSEDHAEAGVYPTAAAGFDRGLVVLARGLPFWLIPSGETFRLFVEARSLEDVKEQLESFERESRAASATVAEAARLSRPSKRTPLSPLIWALLVLAAFSAQNDRPGHWEHVGDLDSQAVFARGEWWRPATALFLHADLGHLWSNLLSGLFVFFAVISALGGVRGWLLLALASFAGNLAAAALNYPGPYESLGASTAVFAGLGLLTGRAIRAVRRHPDPRGWRPALVPLAAGVALLGLYGTGGLHTDLTAHATGFASGLALGFTAGGRESIDRGPR